MARHGGKKNQGRPRLGGVGLGAWVTTRLRYAEAFAATGSGRFAITIEMKAMAARTAAV